MGFAYNFLDKIEPQLPRKGGKHEKFYAFMKLVDTSSIVRAA